MLSYETNLAQSKIFFSNNNKTIKFSSDENVFLWNRFCSDEDAFVKKNLICKLKMAWLKLSTIIHKANGSYSIELLMGFDFSSESWYKLSYLWMLKRPFGWSLCSRSLATFWDGVTSSPRQNWNISELRAAQNVVCCMMYCWCVCS